MLIKKNIDLMINDPNIYEHKTYKMFNIKDVCKKCDVNVFLVRHKEYMEINFNNIRFLDFCGIKS